MKAFGKTKFYMPVLRDCIIACVMLPAVAVPIASTASASDKVMVTINGKHPNGAQWDGTRIFYLPFETTTISPPDLVIVAVQGGSTTFLHGGEKSPCPDSDQCEFDLSDLDPEQPFALVVFDHDGLGEDEVDAVSSAIKETSARLSNQTVETYSGWREELEYAMAAAAMGLSETASLIEVTNRMRLEWIDAVVIVPETGVESSDVHRDARNAIRAIARKDPLASGLRRLDGPISEFVLADCKWPSPACEMQYVTIQLKPTEASDDQ